MRSHLAFLRADLVDVRVSTNVPVIHSLQTRSVPLHIVRYRVKTEESVSHQINVNVNRVTMGFDVKRSGMPYVPMVNVSQEYGMVIWDVNHHV